MSITEIMNLPTREKFQIMELLWEDLRPTVQQVEVPEEHRNLLDERRSRVQNGEVTLLNWDEVKNSVGS